MKPAIPSPPGPAPVGWIAYVHSALAPGRCVGSETKSAKDTHANAR